MPKVREKKYYVTGMHCASCELIIEKKLLSINKIKFVQADTSRGEVLVEYTNKALGIKKLNRFFQKEGYYFFNTPHQTKSEPIKNYLTPFLIALGVLFVFYLLNRSGITGLINISATSSLPAFFIFGLIAGISSCAALVGGLVLSLSKQWADIYKREDNFSRRATPHLLFNLGRLISYALFGILLGFVGSKLSLNFNFASILVIIVAFIMIVLGLQMLGVKYLANFQISAPKFITRYAADESNFKGKYLPFILGALTFFLPCGFTLAAQSLALISGNPWQGGLIMFFFALGTLPALLAIGFSSTKLLEKPHLSAIFVKAAGFLVITFALFNINSQFAVLGLKNIGLFNFSQKQTANNENKSKNDLPEIVDGKQIIKMTADSRGYKPNYFKVRANVPVRWEITDTGTSGCTNAVLSRQFFSEPIGLTPGKTSIQEFTPTTPGTYRFSCWMGMVNGSIEVVDENNSQTSNNQSTTPSTSSFSSGARGCCSGGN